MVDFLSAFNLKSEELIHRGIGINFNADFLELKINNYLDFEYLLSEINSTPDSKIKLWKRYYRGVASTDFSLLCSLCVNNLETYESRMISSMYNNAPDMFINCKNDFEILSMMQHYGLPTRFLDFTKNPLVALWFACQPNINTLKNDDGAVYIAFSNMLIPKRIMDIILKFTRIDNFNITFKGLLEHFTNDELNYYLNYYFHNVTKMNFIETPVLDKREYNQQSVFLVGMPVIAHSVINNNKRMIIKLTENNLTDTLLTLNQTKPTITSNFFVNNIECFDKKDSRNFCLKIIVSEQLKERFLNELAYRGITERFIYPTFENLAKQIKKEAIYENLTYSKKEKKSFYTFE